MLKDGYDAVTKAHQWTWLRSYSPTNIAYDLRPELLEIDKHMEYRHDAKSYAWTLQQLAYLCHHGFAGLAKSRGVGLKWIEFLDYLDTSPMWNDQVETLRKFERGELTYAQMRDLCG